jgi:hypothetical protein
VLDDDLVIGIEAGRTTGSAKGVEDVVLAGCKVKGMASATLLGGRKEDGSGLAPWAIEVQEFVAEYYNMVMPAAEEIDNNAFAPRLNDWVSDRVGLDNRLFCFGKRHAPDIDRRHQGQVNRPIVADGDWVAQDGALPHCTLKLVDGWPLGGRTQDPLDPHSESIFGPEAVDWLLRLAEEFKGKRLVTLLGFGQEFRWNLFGRETILDGVGQGCTAGEGAGQDQDQQAEVNWIVWVDSHTDRLVPLAKGFGHHYSRS